MKNYLYSLVIFSFLSSPILSQDWTTMMKDQNANVHDVQKAFYKWYAEQQKKEPSENKDEAKAEKEDGAYEQFKRWEWFMEPRTYPSGERPKPGAIAIQYAAYRQGQKDSHHAGDHQLKSSMSLGNWIYAGNDSVPPAIPGGGSVSGGDGRINYLRFMPGNNNILFACSPTGGLWTSTNGGASWTTNTDNLADMSVSDIAIDPNNTNIRYISTGDGDGIYGGYTTLSTVGILKSVDGGVTWNPTGLSFPQATTGPTFSTVNQLLMNPYNSGNIYAATSFGLYRTNDSGAAWAQIDTGNFKSIEFEPFHPATIYAGTYNGQFYRTVNGGNTFTQITSGLPGQAAMNRVKIAVSPADSNYVYAIVGTTGIYKSTDRGQTFAQPSNTDPIGYQWWYTMSLAVSPTNADSVIAGGLDIFSSANGGANWAIKTFYLGILFPYVHADIHCITFAQGSGSTYYAACDGGVFTGNQANIWTDISHNLHVGALYNIGPSGSTAGLWLSGWQDNGVNVSSPAWEQVLGGDGMVSFIDYSNDGVWYAENYQGDFQISTNNGSSWTAINTGLSTGPWVTKWMQDPNNPATLYGGFANVWKSTNQGGSWTQISTFGDTNDFISAMAVDPANSNVMYAAQPGIIELTTDGGTTWTNITGSLPVGNAGITDITMDPNNYNHVWVTFSGYSAPDKVYMSVNGGTSWTDYSTGLPNLPVNCILFVSGSANESIYVGTDAGVYYRDTTLSGWGAFNNGLPNVTINDLKISKPTNTLLAATYGRGVWSTPVYTSIDPINGNNGTLNLYPNPTNGKINLTLDIPQAGEYNLSVYNIMGQKVYSTTLSVSGHYSASFDLSQYGSGVYLFTINGQGQTIEKKIVVN